MDNHWIALYLSGQYPGKYIIPNKLDIVFKIRQKDPSNFGDTILALLHGKSDVEYFKTLLDYYLSYHGEDELKELIEGLWIPESIKIKGKREDFFESRIKNEDKKTIGFITPFDAGKDYIELKKFIQQTLHEIGFGNWKIEESSFDIWWEKETLWESVEEFLNKYPLYIANFRDQNLNVALEVGYLQAKNIPFIQIKNEWEKVSDLDWFIYVGSKDSRNKPWMPSEKATTTHEGNQNKFKENLIIQLKRYLK
ncbi:MAG: hypothetical protein ACD_71C00132G0005 [uncultured bacterium (gcode 4)]|uniref:Uncharacterized protein n=1 Tax=uncultured bacterium (gcode 4) TaxID=1234023 RepID=K1ZJ32_9BACT|nr:MAG: hypothetical protein ACD_71C00132G0005 [uncultured bacterium (gcode 4)]